MEFLPDTSNVLGEIIEALNDREINQDLTYGISLAIPYGENLMINVGAQRTNSSAPDVSSDRNAQTKLRMVLQYKISNTFELNGGYSTVLEIKGYTLHSLFLNATARFQGGASATACAA